MATKQAPVPVQPSLQPAKVEPPVEVAVSVTELWLGKLPLQVAEQALMPGGELLTVPVPAPALVTVSEAVPGGAVNVAVTVWLLLRTTLQAPVPLQPPPVQPTKVDPSVVAAVSVTEVPGEKFAVQVAVQPLMPAGALLTVPLPAPLFTTVSVVAVGGGLNVAATV